MELKIYQNTRTSQTRQATLCVVHWRYNLHGIQYGIDNLKLCDWNYFSKYNIMKISPNNIIELIWFYLIHSKVSANNGRIDTKMYVIMYASALGHAGSIWNTPMPLPFTAWQDNLEFALPNCIPEMKNPIYWQGLKNWTNWSDSFQLQYRLINGEKYKGNVKIPHIMVARQNVSSI